MTEVVNLDSISNPTKNVDPSRPLSDIVYDKLSAVGCCKMCSLRFGGETDICAFKKLYREIEEKRHPSQVHKNTENGVKIMAANPCVACLGMLQPPMCEKIIDKIVDAVSKEAYDNPTFNVAFTIPVSFYLRAHAMMVFLVNNYPGFFIQKFPLSLVTVSVKDAWKFVFADKVAQKINKTFNNEAELRIQIDIQYEDDHSEITCLHAMFPEKIKDQKIKTRKLKHVKGPMLLFSRKSVESLLELQDREHFAKFYPVPPTIPSHSAVCNNVLFEQNCIYFGGRYNKYVRGLPQTAWLVQNQRKLETSVHEIIGEQVQALTRAQGSKLISSGREDVDVRMLGSGRPFALELIAPRHVVFSAAEIKELEHNINAVGIGRVSISHLKVIPKSSLDILKSGEEHKTKTYEAYCVAWGVDETRLTAAGSLAPLTLLQKTPVRVLHRRPIATRPRMVHWMRVSDIKPAQTNDTTYFKLTLNTQAGTYIKEFIHGDFGRTKPSLGDLLGGVSADCLALDVQSIELDWPT